MRKILILIFICFCTLYSYSQGIDIRLLRQINLDRNTRMDGFYEGVSNSIYPVGILTPCALFSYGYFTNNASYKEKAITTGTAIALNVVITYGLKYSINRQRPYLTYPDIDNVITESSRSMPSGHTSIAFATATSLSLNFPKWYVAVPAYSWASMVAYSRMHLGVHYPSDILVGALVGSGCAYFSYKANQWIRKKYQ